MDEKELYKLRAEDFARNFLSLRDVEWKVVFEVYAGYALIGGGYAFLRQNASPQMPIMAIVTAGVILLFLASTFLNWQIQLRQRFTRTMQNAYLSKLHETLKSPEIVTPPDIEPKLKWWYAFIVQTLMSLLIALGLVAFIWLLCIQKGESCI